MEELEVLYPFPEGIIIQDRSSAIEHAQTVFEERLIDRFLVIWVDGSAERYPQALNASRLTAAAAAYRDLSSADWRELVALKTVPYGKAFALEAETIAMHEAFQAACGMTYDFDQLVIFTDSQSLLHGMRTKSTFSCLSSPKWIDCIYAHANMLYNLGINVELRWVPARSAVVGNERVDKLARQTRRYAQLAFAKQQIDLASHHVNIGSASMSLLSHMLADGERDWKTRMKHNSERKRKQRRRRKKALACGL